MRIVEATQPALDLSLPREMMSEDGTRAYLPSRAIESFTIQSDRHGPKMPASRKVQAMVLALLLSEDMPDTLETVVARIEQLGLEQSSVTVWQSRLKALANLTKDYIPVERRNHTRLSKVWSVVNQYYKIVSEEAEVGDPSLPQSNVVTLSIKTPDSKVEEVDVEIEISSIAELNGATLSRYCEQALSKNTEELPTSALQLMDEFPDRPEPHAMLVIAKILHPQSMLISGRPFDVVIDEYYSKLPIRGSQSARERSRDILQLTAACSSLNTAEIAELVRTISTQPLQRTKTFIALFTDRDTQPLMIQEVIDEIKAQGHEYATDRWGLAALCYSTGATSWRKAWVRYGVAEKNASTLYSAEKSISSALSAFCSSANLEEATAGFKELKSSLESWGAFLETIQLKAAHQSFLTAIRTMMIAAHTMDKNVIYSHTLEKVYSIEVAKLKHLHRLFSQYPESKVAEIFCTAIKTTLDWSYSNNARDFFDYLGVVEKKLKTFYE